MINEIVDSLLYINTTMEVRQDLHDWFQQSNGQHIFQIHKFLITLSQGEQDVATYYTRLKILWDELKDSQSLLFAIVKE